MLSRKIWKVRKVDKNLASALAEKNTLFPIAALIASSRGIDTDKKVREFFYNEIVPASPFLLTDMDKAVKAISEAVDNFDKIAICGDYDADGITATTLLYSYLEAQGADVICRIPDRAEGYGLKCEAIDFFAQQGVKLIVTVDCGVGSVDEVEYAKAKGINTVITDHHIAGETLPAAVAVVDPYRQTEDCPFKGLAGVGVVFKLLCALEGGESEEILGQYSDIIALGTVGDVMPLVGENRLIVRRGVDMINASERAGILALLSAAGSADRRITSTALAFTLVPRINAAGRMGNPTRALNLLLCDDTALCEDLAEDINNANVLRHKTEVEIVNQINKAFDENPALKYDRVIVVDGEGWQNGVIGIVAARLVDKYGKPSIVITRDGDMARGSGRSFEGFSLFDAIKSCEDVLEHFGGHTLAAGVGIKSENINEFRRRINEYAASLGEMPHPKLKIDCKLNPVAINGDLLNALSTLEPFGAGNPVPVFGLLGMKIESVLAISEGKHTKLILSKNGTKINAMCFGVSPDAFKFKREDIIDLAVTVEANDYMGEVRPSIHVKAVRGNGMDDIAVVKNMDLYEKIKRNELLTDDEKAQAFPSREFMLSVYKFIKSVGNWHYDNETLCYRLGDNGSMLCKVAVSIDAMLELGVIAVDFDGSLTLPDIPVRVDLGSSKLLQALK